MSHPREAGAAACAGWNAGYSLNPKTYHESDALTHAWSVVSACDTFSFHHYRACHNDAANDEATPYPPDTPADSGATCKVLSTSIGATTADEVVHRSDRAYGTRIFACQNMGCTQYYGDGTYGSLSVSNDYDLESTDKERWVLEDVAGFTDADRVVDEVSGDGPGGAGALFYPEGWTLEGTLSLWYYTSEYGIGGVINFVEAETSGWQNFNTADFYAEYVVAQGSDSSDFEYITNPWVIAVDDGENQFIRMFVHVGDDEDLSIYAVDSTDEFGTEFGLTCDDGPCDVGGETDACADGDKCNWDVADPGLQICNDTGNPDCFYLQTAGHGRLLWNYIGDGAVDFDSDDLGMLFTGDNAHGGCTYGGLSDDIYMARWTDDDGRAWRVPLSGSCPTFNPVFEDGHDPAVIPLQNGAYKAYFMDAGASQQHMVCYSDDGTDWEAWEDCAEIEYAFDDTTRLGTTEEGNPMVCIGDMEALAFVDGGGVHEGGFLTTGALPRMDCGADEYEPGEPGDADGPFTYGGIVFVEHRN